MTPGRQRRQLPFAVHAEEGRRYLRRRWLSLVRRLEALRLQSGNGMVTSKEKALIFLLEELERSMAEMDVGSTATSRRIKIPSSQHLP